MILFGMFPTAKAIQVDRNQKKRLRVLARAGKTPQKIALRARIILGASEGLANNAIAGQLGIGTETLRNWVNQAQIDGGQRPGVTSEDKRRIAELEKENRELRRANEILKTASAFFAAAELDRRLK